MFTIKIATLIALFSACVLDFVRSEEPRPVLDAKAEEVTYNVGDASSVTHFMPKLSVRPHSGEDHLVMLMDSFADASFDFSVMCRNSGVNYTVVMDARETNILQIRSSRKFEISCADASVPKNNTVNLVTLLNNTNFNVSEFGDAMLHQGRINVSLATGILGIASINFKLEDNRNGSGTGSDVSFEVWVLRKKRPVDYIFRIIVYCVQVFVTMGFGVKLDLEVVKNNLKRPIAPAIGLACQYIVMPMIAFTVAKLVTEGDMVLALGIFVAGCCPGGGASNMYSYLLKGDLSLSITMTTLSTVVALGMLPMWVYTLGSLFMEGDQVQIPFSNVAISLAIIVVPVVVGVFLRYKFPKVAATISKILKPVIIFFAICLIVLGIYSNLYIFRLFKRRVIFAACLLPYVGYLLGGVIAAIFRQPWKRIKTIALETGMQNTSIAFILLTTSLPVPIGDIAAVAPVAAAVMTPLPPFLTTLVYLTYRKCKKKYAPVPKDADDADKDAKNGEMVNGDGVGVDDKLVSEKLTTV